MRKIKIVIAEKEKFEVEVDKLLEKDWSEQADTYRVLDYGGKIIHSIILLKEQKGEGEK